MTLVFEKLCPEAVMPARKTEKSAGYDLTIIEDVTFEDGYPKKCRTGIRIAEWPAQDSMYGEIHARSHVPFKYPGLIIHGGVVDMDYKGEILIVVRTDIDEPPVIPAGASIAQLIVKPCYFGTSSHGGIGKRTGGFGSTNSSKSAFHPYKRITTPRSEPENELESPDSPYSDDTSESPEHVIATIDLTKPESTNIIDLTTPVPTPEITPAQTPDIVNDPAIPTTSYREEKWYHDLSTRQELWVDAYVDGKKQAPYYDFESPEESSLLSGEKDDVPEEPYDLSVPRNSPKNFYEDNVI